MIKYLRMMIACVNANGESDFFFLKVGADKNQIENGDHYNFAEAIAEEQGYEHPMVSFDEKDSAGKAILEHFVWDSASMYLMPPKM